MTIKHKQFINCTKTFNNFKDCSFLHGRLYLIVTYTMGMSGCQVCTPKAQPKGCTYQANHSCMHLTNITSNTRACNCMGECWAAQALGSPNGPQALGSPSLIHIIPLYSHLQRFDYGFIFTFLMCELQSQKTKF